MTVPDELRRRVGARPVFAGRESRGQRPAEGLASHLVRDRRVRKARRVRPRIRRFHRQEAIELRVPADMVEVGVGVQRRHGTVRQLAHEIRHPPDPEARVEEERFPRAHDQVRDDLLELVGLFDREDAVSDAVHGEPVLRHGDPLERAVRRPRELVAPPAGGGGRAPLRPAAGSEATREPDRQGRSRRPPHFSPVDPKPSVLRAVSGSSSTRSRQARATGAKTSCAIRSPRAISTGSTPMLATTTQSSPR